MGGEKVQMGTSHSRFPRTPTIDPKSSQLVDIKLFGILTCYPTDCGGWLVVQIL